MADAKEHTISLLATTLAVDMNAAGGTEAALFTVPAGKRLIVDHVMVYDFSADAGNLVITLGKTGGDCDEFLDNQTFTASTAAFATEAFKLEVIPNATPVSRDVFTATQVFAVELTTAAGVVCTATFEVWGHLFDA